MFARLDSEGPLDPLELDHALSAAESHWRRWRLSLRERPSTQTTDLGVLKSVTNYEIWSRLRELPEAVPIRERLMAWMYRLMEQRVNSVALCRLFAERYEVLRTFEAPSREPRTLGASWHAALREPARLGVWLKEIGEHGSALGDATVWLWQRRSELDQRLALADRLDAPCSEGLNESARAWLSATEALWREQHWGDLPTLVTAALGREASEGWPVQLNHQALAGWFRGARWFEDVSMSDFELPAALGASSYLRSLELLGLEWHHAAAPRGQPFCISFDPFRLRGHAWGALFSGLLLNPEFLRRKLGLGAEASLNQRRVLARSVLIETRVRSFKVLLQSELTRGVEQFRGAFEALADECFGVHVPKGLAGQIWSPDVEDQTRYAGLFAGSARTMQCIERHDQDWFRNPRALEDLRAEAAMPPEPKLTAEALRTGQHCLQLELGHCLG